MILRKKLLPALLLFPVFALILLTSCHTKPPAVSNETDSGTTGNPVPKEEITEKTEIPDSLDCRLMVNFISTGGGINNDARLSLERYQMKFSMSENLPMRPRRIPKGREGEMEYCYPMDGFSPEKAQEFISGLRELMKDQPLVFISENKKQALH